MKPRPGRGRSRREAEGRPGGRRLLRAFGAFAVLNVLLMAPHWILEGGVGPRWLAVEAAAVAGLVALLPRARWSRALAGGLALLFILVALVDLGDVAARQSLARPLNLYLDLHLLASIRHLLEGTLGVVAATAALVGAGALAVGGAWALARLLTPARGARRGVVTWLGGIGLLVLAGVGIAGEGVSELGMRSALPVVRVVRDQSRAVTRMLREQARFEAVMADRPASYAGRPGLLGRLGGRDVTLAFVESYGMSAVEDPRYAPVVRPRLEAMEAQLDSAGLTVATGVLVAPSQGGQSWFGHGSVLSGLWLDNQMRYDLLLASDRETLVDDFERAGYRTVALMPAITLAWPEGARLGYEEVWAHRDIDYAGPPLNWVTMPDQFTWSFLEETIRPRDPSRPLFAELGLISSHAPWTPILPVLDTWETIGDGSVFERWADAGETPRELWRDADRVREHYALSVEYAVHTAASWAAHFVGPDELAIILGDHQPAPLITGEEASRAVPVHVVSGDPALVEPFLAWGFRRGTLPPPADGARRMDDFRGWFIEAFSSPPGRLASEPPAGLPRDAAPVPGGGGETASPAGPPAPGSGRNGNAFPDDPTDREAAGGGRP